jgi:UPF0391 membrane protein mpe_A2904
LVEQLRPLNFIINGRIPLDRFILNRKEKIMLHYSIVFFIIAIIAAVLGFGGIAGSAAGIAKILFAGFLILSVISLIFGRKK